MYNLDNEVLFNCALYNEFKRQRSDIYWLKTIASLIIGKWGKSTIWDFKHISVRFSAFVNQINGTCQ